MSRTAGAQETLAGLARGLGGAILFALPLLMTMEMWWLGFYLSPSRILLLMVVFFPMLAVLAHYVGFGYTATWGHATLQAITAYGLATVSSGIMLGILAVLGPGTSWHELLGKTAIQAGPGALGALLAQSYFGSSKEKDERRAQAAYVEHLFFMVVGALYVALTVAPTDEMPLIAFMMRDTHVLIAIGFSLFLLHFFMHGIGFEGHAAAEPGSAISTFFRLAMVGYGAALGRGARRESRWYRRVRCRCGMDACIFARGAGRVPHHRSRCAVAGVGRDVRTRNRGRGVSVCRVQGRGHDQRLRGSIPRLVIPRKQHRWRRAGRLACPRTSTRHRRRACARLPTRGCIASAAWKSSARRYH